MCNILAEKLPNQLPTLDSILVWAIQQTNELMMQINK